MPDTAKPINRHPPGSSQDKHQTLVLMSSMPYDTSSMVHCRSSSRTTPATSRVTFPQRSPRQSSANAACGGLEPSPAQRFRRTYLHLQHSTAIHTMSAPTSTPRNHIKGHTMLVTQQHQVRQVGRSAFAPVRVGMGRGSRISPGRLPVPLSRTGRAAFTASGSPRARPAWGWWCWSCLRFAVVAAGVHLRFPPSSLDD
jgi:hypothetical protein